MTVAAPPAGTRYASDHGAIAATLAVLMVFLFFVPRATAIALPLVALTLYMLAIRGGGFTHRNLPAAAMPALPLLGIALASTLWALAPGTTFERGLRLAVETGLATVLLMLVPATPGATPRRAVALGALGLIAASLIALADVAFGGALSGWARKSGAGIGLAYSLSGALLAMAAIPLAVALWRMGRPALAGLMLASALSIPVIGSSTSMIAVPLAILSALSVLALPRLRWAILSIQVAVILLMPLAMPITIDARICDTIGTRSSAMHRIAIWNFAHQQWMTRPLLGFGLESARDLGAKRIVKFREACGESASAAEVLPLHPHNFVMQVWLELGVLGAAAAAWLVACLTVRAWRAAPGRFGYAATTGFAMAAFTIASSSYGLWQSWWVAALVLGSALTLLCGRIATQAKQGSPPDNQKP